MILTYKGFVKKVIEEINIIIGISGLFYLEASETQTKRDGQTYKGVMIQSNLKGAPCRSAFYLEDAYRNYKSQKFDLTDFAMDTVKQFYADFGDDIKNFLENLE